MRRRQIRIGGLFARLRKRMPGHGTAFQKLASKIRPRHDSTPSNIESQAIILEENASREDSEPQFENRSMNAGHVGTQHKDSGKAEIPKGKLDGTWTIDQAWRSHPNAPQVFGDHDLPNCDHCVVRFHETVAEAAEAYEIDLQRFILALQSLHHPD